MMIDLARVKRALTIFAHPDDETLSAGGTLHKLAGLGAEITVIIPTWVLYKGKMHHDCLKALEALGIGQDALNFGTFPDNEMDSVPLLSVIRWMQPLFDIAWPDLVLTHHFGCTNVDHRVCNEAVTILTRPIDGLQIPVLCAESPSVTGYRRPCGFEPNFYVGLGPADLNAKCAAMQCYESQRRYAPHPRAPSNLRALAAVRGAESGFDQAEAFMLLRGFG